MRPEVLDGWFELALCHTSTSLSFENKRIFEKTFRQISWSEYIGQLVVGFILFMFYPIPISICSFKNCLLQAL
jgi:hypothetical protein